MKYIMLFILMPVGFYYSSTLRSSIDLNGVSSKGFFITKIEAKLENDFLSIYREYSLTDSSADLTIDQLSDGDYLYTVQIFSNNDLISESTNFIKITSSSANYFPGKLTFSCSKIILSLKSRPEEIFSENLPLGFEIDPAKINFRTRPIDNVENLVEAYCQNNLPYVIQMDVKWDILDSNKIPLNHYSFGDFRNPVDISHTALAFFQLYYQTGDTLYRQWFFNNINWLMNNHGSDYYYPYSFAIVHSSQSIDSGWVSGMAQSEALKVISRAFFMTGDSSYLFKANKLFEKLYKNTGTKWIFYIDNEDYYWIEEYPNPDFCHVINGKLSSLLGVWDYYAVTRNPFALKIFEGGLKTIIDHIPLYNIEGENASRYCKHFYYSLWDYHLIVKVFTKEIGIRFNIPELVEASSCLSQDDGVQLLSPANNISNLVGPIEFKWRFVNDCQFYVFQLSEDSTFSAFVFTDTLISDTSLTTNIISPDKKYFWRVRSDKFNSNSRWSETWNFQTASVLNNNDDPILNYRFELYNNYPNPFNPTTKIKYSIKERSSVSIKLLNILGEKIRDVINEIQEPGIYETEFHSNGLSSGVYFYVLKAGDFVQIKKMMIIK